MNWPYGGAETARTPSNPPPLRDGDGAEELLFSLLAGTRDLWMPVGFSVVILINVVFYGMAKPLLLRFDAQTKILNLRVELVEIREVGGRGKTVQAKQYN